MIGWPGKLWGSITEQFEYTVWNGQVAGGGQGKYQSPGEWRWVMVILGSGAVMESDGVWPAGALKKVTTGVCSVVSEEDQDAG